MFQQSKEDDPIVSIKYPSELAVYTSAIGGHSI